MGTKTSIEVLYKRLANSIRKPYKHNAKFFAEISFYRWTFVISKRVGIMRYKL